MKTDTFIWSAFESIDPFCEMAESHETTLPRWMPMFDGTEAATSLAVEHFRSVWDICFGDDDNAELIVHITSPEDFAGFYEVTLSMEVTGRAEKKDDPRRIST